MNEVMIKGLLGLSLRARQASVGTDACRIMIRTGRCGLLLLDGNTGPNTRRQFSEMCEKYGVTVRVLPEGMIGESTGRDAMVFGIQEGSFAEKIRNELISLQTGTKKSV